MASWTVVLAALMISLQVQGGAAISSPVPIVAWSSSSNLLESGVNTEALPAAKVLQQLFSLAAAQADSSLKPLAGLLQTAESAEQAPEAVVVVVSAAEQPAASTQQKLQRFISQAASSLQLPNAVHSGQAHPVFAGLRPSAAHVGVKVLGTCVPGGPTAAPASSEALRAHAVREAGAPPVIVVACPDTIEQEEELLDEAQAHLGSWAQNHMIVHVCHGAFKVRQQQQQQGHGSSGRGLLASTAMLQAGSPAANRTADYTYCDPVCRKHVMWMEGLIVFVTLLSAILVAYFCTHAIDVPSRFASADQRRGGGHPHHE